MQISGVTEEYSVKLTGEFRRQKKTNKKEKQ